MTRRFSIACFHEHVEPREGFVSVAIDVLRATTTATTAVAHGLRCYPARSLEAAVSLAARLHDPLLAGELGGAMPYGFHVQNSPAAIAERTDLGRPVLLLSTSGTRLMWEAAQSGRVYVASLRNAAAQAAHLVEHHERVRIFGAGSRGEFRREDQVCCARIGARLAEAGFEPADALTEHVVERWADAPDEAIVGGRSSRYLVDTGQRADLDFVLAHVDDLDAVFELCDGEVVALARPAREVADHGSAARSA